MTYKISATDLTDFEADHISEILKDYQCKLLLQKLEALVENDHLHIEWIDNHLAWHNEVLKKIQFTKE